MLSILPLPCLSNIKTPYTKDVNFPIKSSIARNNYFQRFNQSLSKYKEVYQLEFAKLYLKQSFLFHFIDNFIAGDSFTIYLSATKTILITIVADITKSNLVNALFNYFSNTQALPSSITITFTNISLLEFQSTYTTNKSIDNAYLLFTNKLYLTQIDWQLSHNNIVNKKVGSLQELTNIFKQQDNNSLISWSPIPEASNIKYLRLPISWDIEKVNVLDNLFNIPKYNLTVSFESYY